MTVQRLVAAVVYGAILAGATAASAHHSVSGEFDPSKTIELTGVITKVEWVNPHIYVHLAVVDKDGAAEMWRLETAPPAFMRRIGLTSKKLINDGQKVTVESYPARDGTRGLGFVLKITYSDGHFYQLSSAR
jgi:hypothetical protein